MTQVLVTGGSGFVGRHLVAALLARGNDVRIFDLQSPQDTASNIQFIKGSVLDPIAVQGAMHGVDEIYHLAALPGMWVADANEFHAVNCRGTGIVLEAARNHGRARFLHCSTESILFGSRSSAPIVSENAATNIDDMPGAYTRSKLAAEQLALQAAASGLPAVIAIPTLPIGPDHHDTPPTAMLRHFLKRGTRLYLDFVMNLVDVRDVAAGMILAMTRGKIGERYILGGENMSLKTLLVRAAAVGGRTPRLVSIPPAFALLFAALAEFTADNLTHCAPVATVEGVRIALRSRALSIEKSQRELGYAPRPIEDALRQGIMQIVGARPAKK